MITCGNCKQSHSTVADVKACYSKVDVKRNVERSDPRRFGAMSDPAILGHDDIWSRIASNDARNAEREAAPQRRWDNARFGNTDVREHFNVEDSGIYKSGERIFKVYQNQDGTRMLAKELIVSGDDSHWTYQGMAYRFVNKGQKITKEEAAHFGVIYGVCAICGRTLTDETSIAQGIGPVCIKKMGW